jgi:hypothetical protein
MFVKKIGSDTGWCFLQEIVIECYGLFFLQRKLEVIQGDIFCKKFETKCYGLFFLQKKLEVMQGGIFLQEKLGTDAG